MLSWNRFAPVSRHIKQSDPHSAVKGPGKLRIAASSKTAPPNSCKKHLMSFIAKFFSGVITCHQWWLITCEKYFQVPPVCKVWGSQTKATTNPLANDFCKNPVNVNKLQCQIVRLIGGSKLSVAKLTYGMIQLSNQFIKNLLWVFLYKSCECCSPGRWSPFV